MTRRLFGAMCVSAAAAALWAPAALAVRPQLCKWAAGSGSTLELEGGCHESHARPKTHSTPLGTVTSSQYTAKWGVATVDPGPHHLLGISLVHLTGSNAAIAYVKKRARLKILGNGLVVASKGVIASWSHVTVSCKNPPTGDCTNSDFEGLKGTWEVIVNVVGAPPGSPGAAEEENPTGEDDAQDLAQEELLKGPTVGVGMAILGGV
jgi:hypothetical protein